MNIAGIWLPFACFWVLIFIVGGVSFFRLLKPKKVNLLRIFLVAFMLHFALMPLYGFTAEWLLGHWQYFEEELWPAYLSLYVFLGGVLILLFLYDLFPKKIRRGWTIPQLLEKQYRDIPLGEAMVYFLLIIGFQFGFNIFFGFVSYASSTLERNLAVPYPLVIIKSLTGILVFGLIGYGALHLIRGKKYLYLGLLLLLSNNFLNIYSRRTYMLALIVLILFKLILDRFRIPLRQILIVGGAGIFIFQVFFPFLFVFRQLTIEDTNEKKGNSSFTQTYELSQGARGHELGKGLEANEAYRANQIARNIEFMRFPQSSGRYMSGLILAYQVSAVIPRALNPAKLETGKALAPEAVILLFYGRKGFDLADNLPLYGFLESGYTGAFLAGILQALFLIVFEWFAFRFQRPLFHGLSGAMPAICHHPEPGISLSTGVVRRAGSRSIPLHRLPGCGRPQFVVFAARRKTAFIRYDIMLINKKPEKWPVRQKIVWCGLPVFGQNNH